MTIDIINTTQAKYLVNQMVIGKLIYMDVINARPDLKPYIDAYITENGLESIK